MKKEYRKPIVVVMTLRNLENILSVSGPEKPVNIKVGGENEGDWEVD